MAPSPANEHDAPAAPPPSPDAMLAWEAAIANMTWDEFWQYLADHEEEGLAFGGL